MIPYMSLYTGVYPTKLLHFFTTKIQFWPTKEHPLKMRKKAFRSETKGVFEGTTQRLQSIIHMQDLRQIYFVTNLGYEELRETAT